MPRLGRPGITFYLDDCAGVGYWLLRRSRAAGWVAAALNGSV
jgi:hypothetical protein